MVVVRSARFSERRHLVEIGLAAWEWAVADWGDGLARQRDKALGAYEVFVRDCWPIILVAEEAGKPAGWGAREDRRNTISDLWVDPERQRRGLGSALLDVLEAEVRAAGYADVEVETHARNARAIALYQHRGYVVSALTVRYSEPLDRDIEKVLLRKVLEP